MKIISLVCSAFAFVAMTSVAQATPTVIKQSEPMRLTAPQMNNITAGGVTVVTYAFGTELSYSRSIDFSIPPNREVSIAVACCGWDNTVTSAMVIPHSTRLDPINIINLLNYYIN